MFLIGQPVSAEKESKTLYSETIRTLEKKYELQYNRKINPVLMNNSLTLNMSEFQLAINGDYEIFVDTLITTMQDMKIEDIGKTSEWYESREFGFALGVLTSIGIMNAVN